jgi:hypothetical protein
MCTINGMTFRAPPYKYGIIKILIYCCILLDFLYELTHIYVCTGTNTAIIVLETLGDQVPYKTTCLRRLQSERLHGGKLL